MTEAELIAAFLIARDEDEINPERHLDLAKAIITSGQKTEHYGDCTNMSVTCPRCISDTAIANANDIISLINQHRGIKAVLERLYVVATDQINNTSQLLSYPPKSAAAWDIRNAIQKELDALK